MISYNSLDAIAAAADVILLIKYTLYYLQLVCRKKIIILYIDLATNSLDKIRRKVIPLYLDNLYHQDFQQININQLPNKSDKTNIRTLSG